MLQDKILEIIRKNGNINTEEMMQIALSSSCNAYYQKNQPLGIDADFITAPEVCQIFGEMIGVWSIEQWHRFGCPSHVNILELGPGRGVLMRDLLRVVKKVPEFCINLNTFFLEINPILVQWQRDAVNNILNPLNTFWIDNIDKISLISNQFTIVIANEFFDAMPIRQYIKLRDRWAKIVIIEKEGNLEFAEDIITSIELIGYLNKKYYHYPNNSVIEESPIVIDICKKIAKLISSNGGAGLIIDYGYDSNNCTMEYVYKSTLQGIKKHKFHPVLQDFGSVDLSAHVNFKELRSVMLDIGLSVENIKNQRSFLNDLGGEIRLRDLQRVNPHLSDLLYNQYERITAMDQMGDLFKVMSFFKRKS